LRADNKVFYHASIRKDELIEELPKLTKTKRKEIRLRLDELDSDDWLNDENPLSIREKLYSMSV